MTLRHALKNRIGTDVRLAMILLFAAITVVGVTPFAVVRALNGEWLAFALDLALILVMIASLFAAALWINASTFVGAPVSTTHAIVGGIVGGGFLGVGFWFAR